MRMYVYIHKRIEHGCKCVDIDVDARMHLPARTQKKNARHCARAGVGPSQAQVPIVCAAARDCGNADLTCACPRKVGRRKTSSRLSPRWAALMNFDGGGFTMLFFDIDNDFLKRRFLNNLFYGAC